MKSKGVLVQRGALGGDSLWELTWLNVNNFAPDLQLEVFPEQDSDQSRRSEGEAVGIAGTVSAQNEAIAASQPQTPGI